MPWWSTKWVSRNIQVLASPHKNPQPTTHNPQPTTHNIKMSRRHPTLQRLRPLSPWVGQWRPQILAPRLPMGPQQAPGGGFAIPVAGSLAWGTDTRPVKNYREGRAPPPGAHLRDFWREKNIFFCPDGTFERSVSMINH